MELLNRRSGLKLMLAAAARDSKKGSRIVGAQGQGCAWYKVSPSETVMLMNVIKVSESENVVVIERVAQKEREER